MVGLGRSHHNQVRISDSGNQGGTNRLLYFYRALSLQMSIGRSSSSSSQYAKYYTGDLDEYAEANDYLNQNIFFDLLRSVGGDKPLFNSESHIIADNETDVIPSAHIRNVLWQAAVHGQAASVVWLWEQIVFDEDAKVNTRNSIMNRPDNVVEHGRTVLDLLRLGKEINAFQTASSGLP